jgi:hypothetical protein
MLSEIERLLDKAVKPQTAYSSGYVKASEIESKLSTGENPLYILKGAFKGQKGINSFATLVLTDKAIHVFRKVSAFTKKIGSSHEVFQFLQVTGVTRSRKVTWKWVLEFSRAANTDTYYFLDEIQSEEFYNLAQKLVSEAQNSSRGTFIQQTLDPLDQIKKLKALLDDGILTQKEFDEKKKELMGKV